MTCPYDFSYVSCDSGVDLSCDPAAVDVDSPSPHLSFPALEFFFDLFPIVITKILPGLSILSGLALEYEAGMDNIGQKRSVDLVPLVTVVDRVDLLSMDQVLLALIVVVAVLAEIVVAVVATAVVAAQTEHSERPP